MLGPVLAALYRRGRITVTDAQKMGVKEFGDQLILTQDLDPTYVGLYHAKLPEGQLCRWLLAYWCFYHVGSASWLSEQEGADFWLWMRRAAENETYTPVAGKERWPRAPERRHFRGQKCVDAVDWMKSTKCCPEDFVRSLFAGSGTLNEEHVIKEVRSWPQFGPWIAFKAADMLERVMGIPVQFDPKIGLMYEEPRKALHMVIDQPPGTEFNTVADAYASLSDYFRLKLAPPAMDRRCGPQEVETVLCKWKSYMGGHYYIGKDIHDHRNSLKNWGETAACILNHMPQEV